MPRHHTLPILAPFGRRAFLAAILLGIVGHLFWPVPLVSRAIGVPAGAVLVIAAVGLFVGATRDRPR